MQTVTLKVSDDFMPKLNVILDVLPKNKVRVENSSKIENMVNEISLSLEQAKDGKVKKSGKTISLNDKT
jgi:hypothetical protein